jgi:hypothetical protein
VRESGWFPHKSCSFSAYSLKTAIFNKEVVQKLKFPNNSQYTQKQRFRAGFAPLFPHGKQYLFGKKPLFWAFLLHFSPFGHKKGAFFGKFGKIW